MNRRTFRSSIFITAMLAASAAFAGADIVKCVDQYGKVTLTDAQCGDAVRTVAASASAEAAPAASADNDVGAATVQSSAPVARHAAVRRAAGAPQALQHDSWTAPRAARMLSRDVETLRAARLSMQVLDNALATARQQRLARLN